MCRDQARGAPESLSGERRESQVDGAIFAVPERERFGQRSDPIEERGFRPGAVRDAGSGQREVTSGWKSGDRERAVEDRSSRGHEA